MRLDPKKIAICLLFSCWVFVPVVANDLPGVITLTQVERLYTFEQNIPPLNINQGWQPVTLKDLWTIAIRKQHKEAWYRTIITLDEQPNEPWSIYVPRVSSIANFWINGTEVGSSSQYREPLPKGWNRPVLVTFPGNVLQKGDNILYVHLNVPSVTSGILYEISMGSESILRPVHSRAYFAKITASQILTLLMLLITLVLLVLCINGRQPKSYLWFLLGSFFWMIYSTNLYVEYIPISARWWQGIVKFSLTSSVVFYSFAVHQMLHLKRYWYEKILWSLLPITILSSLLTEEIELSRIEINNWFMCILLASILGLTLCWAGWKGRKYQLWLFLPGCFVLLMAWYDLYIVSSQTTALFAKTPYIPLVAVFMGGIVFFSRFLRTDKEFSQLKFSLGSQLKEAKSLAVVEERSRLMREIHDGVGGQLTSTLSMLEQKKGGNQDIVDSLKTSLEDLRLIVNSLETMGQEGDIVSLLATMRDRIENQLSKYSIQLDWKIRQLPPLHKFGSEQSLQLMRIIQEAITNVLKHSRATTICVSCGESCGEGGAKDDRGVFIEIANDGGDTDKKAITGGHGLKNMQYRSESMGGLFSFKRDAIGAVVRIWIPLKEG